MRHLAYNQKHPKYNEREYLLQSEVDFYLEVCEYCGTEKHDMSCCGEVHFKRIIIDIHENEWDEHNTIIIDDVDGPYDFDR